jgi:hypothetical protein
MVRVGRLSGGFVVAGRVGLAAAARVLVVALAALLLAGPGAALAAGTTPVPALPGSTSPFSPGVPVSPPTTPTAATPTVVNPNATTTSAANGLSGTNAVLIAIGAVIVLGGIAYFIWRDARRRAPVRHAGAAALDAGGHRGSKRPVKSRKLSPAERKRRKRGRAR